MSRAPKAPVTVPAGLDITIEAGRVRQGMWVMGAGMNDFAFVRSFRLPRPVCRIGRSNLPERADVSFHRVGQRWFELDEPVAVRVPLPFDTAVLNQWGTDFVNLLSDSIGMLAGCNLIEF